LIFASAAAANCITKMGAQPSIPKENDVRSFLNKNIPSIKNLKR
jgi:sugar/nucleoside kinase (ribokinase family)